MILALEQFSKTMHNINLTMKVSHYTLFPMYCTQKGMSVSGWYTSQYKSWARSLECGLAKKLPDMPLQSCEGIFVFDLGDKCIGMNRT